MDLRIRNGCRRSLKWYSQPAAPERWLWYVITLLVGTYILFSPDPAFAGQPQIAGVLCHVTAILGGTTGRAIATVGVIGVGLMAVFGIISWGTVLVICSGIALIFGAQSVTQSLLPNAQACTAVTPFSFSCNGAAAVGNLFAADQLVQQQNDLPDSVIAHVLFFFKNEVGQIMSAMYCALSNELLNPFRVVVTLFVVVFGIMIITGMSDLNMKEAGVFVFKLVLAWAFTMNADWAIGIGYTFFMNFAEEGSNIVLGNGTNAGATLAQPDNVIKGLFSTTTTGSEIGLPTCTATTPPGTPCNLPTCGAGTPAGSPCMPAIQVPKMCILLLWPIFALLAIFMPYLMFLIAILIITYFFIFLRSLLHYLTALVLISFLFMFAPFFVAFGLFRTTAPLFHAWVKHLCTFAIQIVVVFAFLKFLSMVPIAQFFANMLGLLRDYNVSLDFSVPVVGPFFTFTMHWCGICQYHLTNPQDMTSLACDVYNTTTKNAKTATDAAKAGYILSSDGHFFIISLWNFMAYIDLAKDIVIGVLALVIVCIVLGDFMKKVPEMAKHLGGVASAAALGGGGGRLSGPGISFAGMESLTAGFTGMKNGIARSFRDPNFRLRDTFMGGVRLTPGERRTNQHEYSFLGGMLYGAGNTRSAEHRNIQKKIERLYEQLARETDPVKREHLEKRILALESQSAGKYQRGLFKHGIHESSLRQRDYGYEGDERLARMTSAHRHRSIYGAYEKQNPGNWYFGMKMPQGVDASRFRLGMSSLKSSASSQISGLEARLASANLPPHKQARIESMIRSASMQLNNANSAAQVERIMRHLNSIEGMLK